MRSAFPEFYGPDAHQMKDLIGDGLLVLDTNVLLELYRVTTADREDIQGLLRQHFEGRVWIPWRVGFEFHRRRLEVVRGQAGHYGSALELGRADQAALLDRLRGLQLPDAVRERIEALVPQLVSAIESARQTYRTTVQDLTHEHVITPEVAINDDPVLSWLNTMIGENVGDRWTKEKLDEETKKGQQRIKDGTPPGYKDAGKPNETDQVGDYLIWRQILDKAVQMNDLGDSRPGVLFVSNDVKEDWVEKSGGRVIGPRPELRAEFQQAWPGRTYHQVTLSGLLDLAKTHLAANISSDAVQRVNDLEAAATGATRWRVPATMLSWIDLADRDPDAVLDAAYSIAARYPADPHARSVVKDLIEMGLGMGPPEETTAVRDRGATFARYLDDDWMPQHWRGSPEMSGHLRNQMTEARRRALWVKAAAALPPDLVIDDIDRA